MRLSKIMAASAVVALLALASNGFSDTPAPAANTGSVSGVVKGVDGKPAAGVTVRVVVDTKGKKPADKTADDNTPKKKAAADAVGTATTDDQGAFKIENIPAGTYTVQANKQGSGHAKAFATVKAGENFEVNLQLTPAKKKNS